MTVSGKQRGLRTRSFFGRKKSTYGLILPEELETQAQLPRRRAHRMNYNSKNGGGSGVKDCFVPEDLDRWELPQYESLFNHLITQDGTFRRRLSSSISNNNSHDEQEETNSTLGEGPLKAVQKWFKEIVKSITHHSGDYDLGGDVAVDGIPVEICEKLRYVHVYL